MDVTGARIKVERARVHIAAIETEVAAWLARVGDPCFEQDVLDDGRTHVVRLVHVPSTPQHWGAIVGDVLHNLRSALDLLAWQAVIAGGGTPGKKTGFPVFQHNRGDAGDKGVTLALKGAKPDFVEAVRRFQPYNRCHSPVALRNDALWVLHRLNIEDKHHLLVTCAAVVGDVSHEVPYETLGGDVTVTLQPARDGAEVLRYSNIPKPVDRLVIDPHGAFDVWIAETDETAYIAVKDLHGLVQQTAAVIDAFARDPSESMADGEG
jgi:hypothetical protein